MRKELDLWSWFSLIKRNVQTLAASTVLLGAVTFLISWLIIPPQYTASVSLYVSNLQDRQSVTSVDLNTSQRLMQTYLVVLTSNTVLDQVTGQLDNHYSADDLRNMISAEAIDSTEAFRISVTSSDPSVSTEIANALATAAPSEIIRVVKAGSVEVIDYATLPTEPSSPNVARNTAVGALVGLAFSALAITLAALLDTTIRREEDLSEHFSLPVLGVIPAPQQPRHVSQSDFPAALRRQVLGRSSNFTVVEAYKAARTNLLALQKKTGCRVFVFTSPFFREGASVTCANLAIVLARNGQNVLLIDADLRWPMLDHAFSLSVPRGLSEYLAETASGKASDVSALVARTNQEHLFLLPAGSPSPNPAELLASPRMEHVLSSLSPQFDFILLNTPPVTVVTDAAVLAGQADGCLLVTRAGVTPMAGLETAVRRLEQSGAHLLGFLLSGQGAKADAISFGHFPPSRTSKAELTEPLIEPSSAADAWEEFSAAEGIQ